MTIKPFKSNDSLTATPRIVFLVGRDDYFLSHRQPAARAAMELGYAVTVLTRDTGKRSEIEALGCQFIEGPEIKSSSNVLATSRAIFKLRGILRDVKPSLLHNIGLQNTLIGLSASITTDIYHVCNSINGVGYLFTSNRPSSRITRLIVLAWLKILNSLKSSYFIFQNEQDRAKLQRLGVVGQRNGIIRGSGVDVKEYPPTPLPEGPITIGMACRMINIKGVRDVCAAMQLLEKTLPNVRLRLAGEPDYESPDHISDKDLQRLGSRPNISLEGYVRDMEGFWRRCHIAALPSHGGEGVPMALLQPASMGRPIITTDTSGNNTICEDGVNGFLVPPRNAEALAHAIMALAQNPNMLARMGAASIQRVLEGGFTADAVQQASLTLYQSFEQPNHSHNTLKHS